MYTGVSWQLREGGEAIRDLYLNACSDQVNSNDFQKEYRSTARTVLSAWLAAVGPWA
jgi:hypothetical protein